MTNPGREMGPATEQFCRRFVMDEMTKGNGLVRDPSTTLGMTMAKTWRSSYTRGRAKPTPRVLNEH